MDLDTNRPQTTKIFGTTVYIGSVNMDTRHGPFVCHTYQNLIHKGYILALAYGDLSAPELFTRVHSSCVTSETLRSMDCDCVHQLEGAIETIAKSGNGILFYLIQEGRGCGYVGKSRACMLVQYHDDHITTFDAYQTLGMKADYRDYRNIWEVAHMLGIANSTFVLLTNNPDKIRGMQQIGLKVSRVESIETAPSPFNQSYLVSKEKMGHLLFKTKTKISRYKIPFEKVKPFEPYCLPQYSRFIHCASYYIPIKPVDNQMEFSSEDLANFQSKGIAFETICSLNQGSYLVSISDEDLDKVPVQPYWFKVNMYYDLASHCDYIVLTYGDLENKIPLVRIHSESLFNRFPLNSKIYREKYKRSLSEIIKNQSGIIALLYHDGRGAGLGNYVLNQTQNILKTGIPIDSRDYSAVAMLLDSHLPQKSLKILYSGSSRVYLKKALDKQGLDVLEWIQLTQKDQKKGHELISRRIQDAPYYLLNLPVPSVKFEAERDYIISGIGGSEAHARYFMHLMQRYHPDINIRFLPITAFGESSKDGSVLILISQGLSPNVWGALEAWKFQDIILLTSVTLQNSDLKKVAVLKELANNGCTLCQFPMEDEYTTLIRTVGPLVGYYFIYKLLHPSPQTSLADEKFIYTCLSHSARRMPPDAFFDSLKVDPQVVILVSYPLHTFFKNIVSKLEEGAFIHSVRLVDTMEFSHGVFQNVEYQYSRGRTTHFVLISNSASDRLMFPRIKMMLGERYPFWELDSQLPEDLSILEYEMIFNHFVLRWIESMNIDQVSWAGKERQNFMYNWHLEAPAH